MIEALVLGALQGVLEWLPVSSEGMLVLANLHLFGETDLLANVSYALFLHIGTMLAAVVYFWNDIITMLEQFFSRPHRPRAHPRAYFIIIATIGAAPIAILLLSLLETHNAVLSQAGSVITIGIGGALIITAYLIGFRKKCTTRITPNWLDGVLVAIGQGLAVIPGISRSGTTTALLLMRQVDTVSALRLSFLAGIPVMYGWGMWESVTHNLVVTDAHLLGLLAAFVVGLITIHLFLRVAARINFSVLVAVFGVLTILAGVV